MVGIALLSGAVICWTGPGGDDGGDGTITLGDDAGGKSTLGDDAGGAGSVDGTLAGARCCCCLILSTWAVRASNLARMLAMTLMAALSSDDDMLL